MQLIVLTNRNALYLPATLDTIVEHVTGIDRLTVVDDSGDADWRRMLATVLAARTDMAVPTEVIAVAERAAGYPAAMQAVFAAAEGEHVALWEEDFHATADIDLAELGAILDDRPHLAQVALLRQPWFANEIAAGGVLEAKAHLGDEIELVDGVYEHRSFFTCNPTVLPRRTLDHEWPQRAWSESAFGQRLLRDASVRFGMMPGVRVEHVGAERTGFDY
jgi:hypothetical protein